MSFKEKRVRETGRAHQRVLHVSLLAMMIASGIAQAAGKTNSEQTLTVDASASADAQQEQAAKDYSVPVTRAGTKMALTARDIPQSVSIISKQRMQDQQLQSLNDVLSNTTGIRGVSGDMDRTNY